MEVGINASEASKSNHLNFDMSYSSGSKSKNHIQSNYDKVLKLCMLFFAILTQNAKVAFIF